MGKENARQNKKIKDLIAKGVIRDINHYNPKKATSFEVLIKGEKRPQRWTNKKPKDIFENKGLYDYVKPKTSTVIKQKTYKPFGKK